MGASTTTSSSRARPHGCDSSSMTAICPPATSTSEASRTLSPATCAAIDSAISSPASADGPTPWLLPDGRLIDPSGLAAALVNLSPRQVRELGLRTSGISGRPGSTSSRSADLQSSLASRLRARLGTDGSTLFRQTWRDKATPSGIAYSAHTASAHRTSGSDSGSWPTPTSKLGDDRRGSPSTATALKRFEQGRRNLDDAAALATWPTPTARDAGDTPEQFLARKRRAIAKGSAMGVALTDLGMVASMAAWPLVDAASWATPTTRDWKSDRCRMTAAELYGSKGQPLARQSLYADSGQEPTGSLAETASGGQLSPAHSRWLMGYPAAWCDSAVTAMQSFRRSRPSSSALRSKRGSR